MKLILFLKLGTAASNYGAYSGKKTALQPQLYNYEVYGTTNTNKDIFYVDCVTFLK